MLVSRGADSAGYPAHARQYHSSQSARRYPTTAKALNIAGAFPSATSFFELPREPSARRTTPVSEIGVSMSWH